ncbi:unnamed protein product [Ectocarpus sp. CCAP 1310/34]|nr:unnamed protein product [Ectocarpus sp. CCAP 1310/34]
MDLLLVSERTFCSARSGGVSHGDEEQGAGVVEHLERTARKGGAPRHKRRLAT